MVSYSTNLIWIVGVKWRLGISTVCWLSKWRLCGHISARSCCDHKLRCCLWKIKVKTISSQIYNINNKMKTEFMCLNGLPKTIGFCSWVLSSALRTFSASSSLSRRVENSRMV